jgi:hypothetical protein
MVLPLIALLLVATAAPAADEPSAQVSYLKMDQGGTVAAPGGDDAQMDLRKSDFFRFARSKIDEMNRNHRLSRSRMQIERKPDGSYRALYHQIDDTSMACEVSRSKSKAIPYVAVLSYREQVFATSCSTPESCRQGQFAPVEVIPNRHIFSYKNGAWQ